MKRALTFQESWDLTKTMQITEGFDLPKREGRICAATHFDLGVSEVLHYHDRPHLTLILDGGVIDKRKRREAEKVSSELMFFNAGERHQTINKRFPTKYVSLTFEPTFLRAIRFPRQSWTS